MTQDEIRAVFSANSAVWIQVAQPGDGSPELAWGDTFIYVRDRRGAPRKMPFATIVTKDYAGFDAASALDRGGLYRLNIDAGSDGFAAIFGFPPREMENRREGFDFRVIDRFFPHPVYGQAGWISIINPGPASASQVLALLEQALQRALAKAAD